MKINSTTKIADILKEKPEAITIFEKYNMGCLSCLGIQNETLEKGALMHGIPIEKILEEINNLQCKNND
jgi:hybrid cluster-associated redox disulfide protein